MTSQPSSELGTFIRPTKGIRCQKRSGRPMSEMTKPRHITMALIASSSPKMVISLIGFQL